MTTTSLKDIYNNIKQELTFLDTLSPNNSNLNKLNKKIESLKNNKDALLIILNWLIDINKKIHLLSNKWKDELNLFIKNLINNIN